MKNLCDGPEFPLQSLIEWSAMTQRDALSQSTNALRFQEMRLEDLVLDLLDLDQDEAARIDALAVPISFFARSPERFNEAVHEAIRQLRLSRLFFSGGAGEFHRGICPTAYDARAGEHHPTEMARWRADFRDMAPERQMVAATLVWMYRGGPDSIWLRRVPCTWRAVEALNYLRDAGCLDVWLRLVARCPGW